jgi:hypothetical protein
LAARRLLFEKLSLYSLGKNRRFTFRFDRGSAGLAAKVAAELETRLEIARPLTLTEAEERSSGVIGVQELQEEGVRSQESEIGRQEPEIGSLAEGFRESSKEPKSTAEP